MKAKHILTAIALPALLAACSQDELGEVVNQDYCDVTTVDVTFTATKSDDASTRMATKFGWEEGDVIGLGLLNSSKQVTYDNPLYCLDPTAGTFTNGNGNLRVGDYVAYMPYAGLVNDACIPFDISEQEMVTSSDEMAASAIYISPELISLEEANDKGEVSEGAQEAGTGKNVEIYLSRLSNALTLNLNFENISGLTDLKVTNVAINMTGSQSTTLLLPVTFSYKPNENLIKNVKKDWSEVSGSDFFASTNKCINESGQEYCGTINLTSEDGVAVSGNQLNVYAWVLPARVELTTSHNLDITVTTNYGVVKFSKDDIEVTEGGKDVDWTKAGIFTKFGQAGTIDLTIDGEALTVGNTEVATQAELEDLLNTLATSGQEDAVTVTLNPTKANTDNTFVLEDFTMPENLQAAITLAVDGTKAGSVVFEGDNVINRPLTINAGVHLNGNMTVKNCVDTKKKQVTTLALSAWFNINAGAVLTNEGEIEYGGDSYNPFNINAADATKKLEAGKYVSAAETSIFTITNDGKVNNYGEIQWIAGTRPSIGGDNTGIIYAEVKDFATLVAADKANVKVVRFMEEASFNNLNADMTIENIETIECYAPVAISINKHAVNGTCDIIFSKVESIVIAEDASLSITSDDQKNTLKLASSATVTGDEGTSFSLNNLTLTNGITVDYVDNVTIAKVSGTVTDGGHNGTFTTNK